MLNGITLGIYMLNVVMPSDVMLTMVLLDVIV